MNKYLRFKFDMSRWRSAPSKSLVHRVLLRSTTPSAFSRLTSSTRRSTSSRLPSSGYVFSLCMLPKKNLNTNKVELGDQLVHIMLNIINNRVHIMLCWRWILWKHSDFRFSKSKMSLLQIYVFLYLWFVFLAAVSGIWLLYRLLTIVSLVVTISIFNSSPSSSG